MPDDLSIGSLSESEIRDACALLSSERIAAFIAITGNDRDAVELHQQMLRVSAALMPVTAIIEIALRNAVCDHLRVTLNMPDWLMNPPSPFSWRGEEADALKRAKRQAQRAAYAKLTQSDKRSLDQALWPNGLPATLSHEERVKARQRSIPVTAGQIIAHLTLGFWKRLFSADYEAALWKRSLKRVFPNKALSRANIAQRLEDIYQARNRIAHHEPLYGARLTRTLESIDFVCAELGPKVGERTVLSKLASAERERLQIEADALNVQLSSFVSK